MLEGTSKKKNSSVKSGMRKSQRGANQKEEGPNFGTNCMIGQLQTYS